MTVDERDKVLPRRLKARTRQDEITQQPRSGSVKDLHRSSVVVSQESWTVFVLVRGGEGLIRKVPARGETSNP